MNDQLPMFDPMSCEDIPSVTSSPASESGPTRSGSPAGPTTAKSGRAAVPASHSARPEKARRSTTKGIYGQSSFDSSKHDDLSFALASKLRPLTDSLGSTLFALTWTVRVTPAGRSISALRASEPRTEGSVFIGWPNPNARDFRSGMENRATGDKLGLHAVGLNDWAILAAWPTTRAEDAESSGMWHSRGVADTMTEVASLTAWGSPQARDWKSGSTSQDTLDKNARPLSEQAVLAGWPTPVANDDNKTPEAHLAMKQRMGERDGSGSNRTAITSLQVMAQLGAWPTPMAGTPAQKGYNEAGNTDSGRKTVEMCQWPAVPSTGSGETPIGYLLGPNGWVIVPASGQLNGAHSRWLMGLPPEWDDCGVTAMASLRKSRKRS